MNRNPEIHQKERKCEERFGKDGQQTDADERGRRTIHLMQQTQTCSKNFTHTNTNTPAFTLILSLKDFHPQLLIQ